MKLELDHIGIAVHDLQSVIQTLERAFDLQPDSSEEVSDQKVRIADYNLSGSVVEFFEPTAEDSPVKKFLQKKGNGLHHIALKVKDIDLLLAQLKKKGFRLIDEKAKTGAGGKRIAFLHPQDFNGILIELCEAGS